MTAIKYLLDENLSPRLWQALRRRAPALVVWRVGDPGAPPFQTQDPDILRWCEASGLVLVTHNRKSMTAHLQRHLQAGGHVPGIFVLSETMTLRQILDELVLVAGAASAEEFADLLLYLPLT